MLLFTTSVTHSVSYKDGENSNVQGFMAHSVLKYSLLILNHVYNNNFVSLWLLVMAYLLRYSQL